MPVDPWFAVDNDPNHVDPEPEPVCPVGFDNHTWTLSVYEGTASLWPVEPCPQSPYSQQPVCHWFEPHDLFARDEMTLAVVKLKFATDCAGSGYDGIQSHGFNCDCNRWLDITPADAGEESD